MAKEEERAEKKRRLLESEEKIKSPKVAAKKEAKKKFESKKRKELELILHPRIAQAGQLALTKLEAAGHPYAVYEAALIFENGLENAFDATILVTTTTKQQSLRIQRRDGLSEQEAEKRIKAQMPLSEKEQRASFIIQNNGTQEDLKHELAKVWQDITGTMLVLTP